MQKIVYTEAEIKKVAIHTVGNKLKGDSYLLSDQEIILGGQEMEEYFLKTTLKPIKNDKFFTFNNSKNNKVYDLIQPMMDGKDFIKNSKEISKHLFDVFNEPKAEGGHLVFVQYRNVIVDDELKDAIGIFKLKKAEKRLIINPNSTRYEVGFSNSYDLSKIDKGVMIYDYDSENGYLISVLDKPSKNEIIQYWSESFLDIVSRQDTIYYTNNALDVVQDFVLEGMPADTKTIDKINLLNDSIKYCKENVEFDYDDFAKEVFKDNYDDFLKYKKDFELENNLESKDSFYVDEATVKKRAKKFKTIIKLDDNFNIVVKEGSNSMIDQGTDETGRKYYKLFYKVEE